jgi:hypothetical protein
MRHAKKIVERDVPKNVYGVKLARNFGRPLPKKVTTRSLRTARPISGPLGTIFGRTDSSLGDIVAGLICDHPIQDPITIKKYQ